MHPSSKDACFDQLRTKEQLGYAVSCGTVTLEHSLNLVYFLVQSAVQPPSYLLNRTWEFVHAFKNVVLNDLQIFSTTVDVYKTLLQAKDKTLEDQVGEDMGSTFYTEVPFQLHQRTDGGCEPCSTW